MEVSRVCVSIDGNSGRSMVSAFAHGNWESLCAIHCVGIRSVHGFRALRRCLPVLVESYESAAFSFSRFLCLYRIPSVRIVYLNLRFMLVEFTMRLSGGCVCGVCAGLLCCVVCWVSHTHTHSRF